MRLNKFILTMDFEDFLEVLAFVVEYCHLGALYILVRYKNLGFYLIYNDLYSYNCSNYLMLSIINIIV